jgi:hypothetical protein
LCGIADARPLLICKMPYSLIRKPGCGPRQAVDYIIHMFSHVAFRRTSLIKSANPSCIRLRHNLQPKPMWTIAMASFGLDEISIFAVLTGVLHHFLVQYPRQARLFTTVLFFLVANLTFAVSTRYCSALGELDPVFGSSQALVWFGACYVNLSVGSD